LIRHTVAAAALLLFPCAARPAADLLPPHESWTFTLRFENDLFADTDRFYTNGLKASWASPDLRWFQDLEWFRKPGRLSRLANGLIDALPWAGDTERRRNLSLSVGQMMYTPQDIRSKAPLPEDRPYAGWLYGSAAFHSKTYRTLDTFEIQAGFTGPWSFAEHVQDLVHDLRGIARARGWDHQIDTEPAFALVYDRKYRIVPRIDLGSGWGFDAIVHGGLAAGTAFTHAAAGIEVRFGWNVPMDFGTALIRPAGETNAPAVKCDPAAPEGSEYCDPRYSRAGHAFSFHLFAAASGRAVLRDIFLDGNTFSRSPHVDKEPLVGDFMFGASLIYRRVKLSYAQVLRTEEFRRQPDWQNFGSVTVSFTY
jgi:lipid A 3-O-deacylase